MLQVLAAPQAAVRVSSSSGLQCGSAGCWSWCPILHTDDGRVCLSGGIVVSSHLCDGWLYRRYLSNAIRCVQATRPIRCVQATRPRCFRKRITRYFRHRALRYFPHCHLELQTTGAWDFWQRVYAWLPFTGYAPSSKCIGDPIATLSFLVLPLLCEVCAEQGVMASCACARCGGVPAHRRRRASW